MMANSKNLDTLGISTILRASEITASNVLREAADLKDLKSKDYQGSTLLLGIDLGQFTGLGNLKMPKSYSVSYRLLTLRGSPATAVSSRITRSWVCPPQYSSTPTEISSTSGPVR